MFTRRTVLSGLLAGSLSLPAVAQDSSAAPARLADGWGVGRPADAGLDPHALSELVEKIECGDMCSLPPDTIVHHLIRDGLMYRSLRQAARLTDPKDPNATDVNMIEARIKAGVLLAAPGNGGDSLSDNARENYSALNPDFSHMTTKTLVVAGDADLAAHLTVRGADWYRDPFREGPGADAMLTLIGGKHGLGGVAGSDAKETRDEDPDRLAVVQHMSWAYLRSAFDENDHSWSDACRALKSCASAHGHIDFK